MNRELLTRFLTELDMLKSNELTVVRYDKDVHDLIFNQAGISIHFSYLRLYFLPKPGFKIGVLNSHGLMTLKSNISSILATNELDNGVILPVPNTLSTDWYKCFKDESLPYPIKFKEFKYVNIINPLLVKFTCYQFSESSKLLYKAQKKKV